MQLKVLYKEIFALGPRLPLAKYGSMNLLKFLRETLTGNWLNSLDKVEEAKEYLSNMEESKWLL